MNMVELEPLNDKDRTLQIFFILNFRPFDQKNPYIATLSVNRELHTHISGRSCRHLEFNVDNTRVRYEAGDHIGIFPKNNSDLVERIASLLNADLETVFKLINLDGEFFLQILLNFI